MLRTSTWHPCENNISYSPGYADYTSFDIFTPLYVKWFWQDIIKITGSRFFPMSLKARSKATPTFIEKVQNPGRLMYSLTCSYLLTRCSQSFIHSCFNWPPLKRTKMPAKLLSTPPSSLPVLMASFIPKSRSACMQIIERARMNGPS